jgi:hypothetical protein
VDSEEVEKFASLCAPRDIKRDIKVNGMKREQAFALVGWYQASPWRIGEAVSGGDARFPGRTCKE